MSNSAAHKYVNSRGLRLLGHLTKYIVLIERIWSGVVETSSLSSLLSSLTFFANIILFDGVFDMNADTGN